jgi:TRAP-type mannitol/chloroaromatic compound transport system permease small subunit
VKPLLAVCQAIDTLNERFGRVANWLVLAACMISAGNAAARYSLNIGSNAWLEIQWYLFGALVMLGAPYTLKVNEHVRVDVRAARLCAARPPGRVRDHQAHRRADRFGAAAPKLRKAAAVSAS